MNIKYASQSYIATSKSKPNVQEVGRSTEYYARDSLVMGWIHKLFFIVFLYNVHTILNSHQT